MTATFRLSRGAARAHTSNALLCTCAARALLLACALTLAGCETVGGLNGSRPQIAEREDDNAAAGANLESLNDVVKRNPGNPEAFNTRGVALAKIGRYQEAISDFSNAVKLDPNNAPALTNRALAYRQINRNDAALNDFTRAVTSNPNHAPAYLGRANLLRAQGNLG